jgi:hypothetical protein
MEQEALDVSIELKHVASVEQAPARRRSSPGSLICTNPCQGGSR